MKFSHAFLSSSFVLAFGVIIWLTYDVELSLLGALSWWSLPIGAVAGALLYGLLFWVTRVFWMRVSSMQLLMSSLHSRFKEFSWPAIIVISIMAGVGEELLIRGGLQNILVNHIGPVFGLILASLVFGLMHYLSKTYVLVTFALGLAFGVVYHLTDSLVLVMVIHAIYDIFAFAVIVKYPELLNIDKGIDVLPIK